MLNWNVGTESERKFVQPTPLVDNDWSYHPIHYLVIQVIRLSGRGWWWFPPNPPGHIVLYDVAGEENTLLTPTRSSASIKDLIVSVNVNDVSYLASVISKITVSRYSHLWNPPCSSCIWTCYLKLYLLMRCVLSVLTASAKITRLSTFCKGTFRLNVRHLIAWRVRRCRLQFFFNGAVAPIGPGTPHYRGFTITTNTHHTGRTPQEEWSSRHRDLNLTTHNTQKGQTPMSPAGFEPTFPAGERPQTHSLDRAATGAGRLRDSINRPIYE